MAKEKEKLPKLALDLPLPKGGGSGEEPDEDEMGSKEPDADDSASPDEVALFTEMKGAIKSGDDASGAASLKAFIKSCMGY